MTCALPVVGMRTDGLNLLVKDGVTGFIAEQEDESGMAHYLDLLAADREKRRTMGLAGKRKAMDFSPDVVGRQWVDMLSNL
jgi:glycosyltransferase involved in cell wall biosynthesis